MEVTQFYLHLPSNSSLDKFPHNTLTEYRVSLPQTLNLTGEWEVALTEIHYPHSWNNIQQFRFYVRNEKLHGVLGFPGDASGSLFFRRGCPSKDERVSGQ